jgi:ubiquinone/menaquinone biosynthesis C-methylase UbiE
VGCIAGLWEKWTMTFYPPRAVRHFYLFLYRILYNEVAWTYDLVSWVVSFGRWDEWRRTALRFVHGERILEVGFGTGELLPLLAVKVERTYGLDASAAMHRITEQKLHRRSLRIPRVQGVAQQIPFADGTFDAIITTFPAGFILDPDAHQEFARVLRPGGRLIVIDVQLVSHNPFMRAFHYLVFPPVKGAKQRYQEATAAAALSSKTHLIDNGPVQVVVTVSEKAK